MASRIRYEYSSRICRAFCTDSNKKPQAINWGFFYSKRRFLAETTRCVATRNTPDLVANSAIYAAGCQPASTQSDPLTALLRSMNTIASATSSGRSNRLNCVCGRIAWSIRSSPSARTIGVSV